MDRMTDFAALAAAGVRTLQPYVPGKPVDELEREYGVSDSVKLASNENPLGPPAMALDAIRARLTGIAEYPDGSGFYLKRALAAKWDVEPACITLGNGSNELLVLLAEAFLAPGVAAIVDQHAFAIYRLAVQATGASLHLASSHGADAPQPLGHNPDELARHIDDSTRLIFIANPNNPTGTWLSGAVLRAFIDRVPAHCLVVVDEAYGEYVTSADQPSAAGWLDECPNLVVTRTFSKIYGLAGLRIGYALSHPGVAELLNRVRAPFNVNGLALAAAEAALADTNFAVEARRLNTEGLDYLTRELRALGFDVPVSRGNFVLADCREPADRWYESLLRRGIIVRPLANYGLPQHLRITVGTPPQNRRVVDALTALRAAG